MILGVDIGRQGAAALLTPDRDLVDVADLPLLADGPSCRPAVNGALFAGMVRRWQPTVAFVEFVGPRPSDGAKAAFAFGGARATIETALTVLGVRVAYLTPPVWKRLIGIPPGTGMKHVARSAAVRRWPSKAEMFARAKDDGRAEAALIAVAGMMKEGRTAAMNPSQMSRTRQEVMVEVIRTYKAARDEGRDGWKAVETAFPGIPADVVADAWFEVESDATEAWWQTVERTIEGEVIRNALAKVSA